MKVLQIIFNPKIDGKFLTSIFPSNPVNLAIEIKDVLNLFSPINIIDIVVVNDFSLFTKTDGYIYTNDDYINIINKVTNAHDPDIIDYDNFLDKMNIVKDIDTYLYDEVWVFGVPWLGLYESRMCGNNTHWLNAPGLELKTRNFVIMGLNYERDLACALEAFAHRIEAIFFTKYEPYWKLFKNHVGTVHIPPNGKKDYDFDNEEFNTSYCDCWKDNVFKFNFTDFRKVNREEWKDTLGYHTGYMKWWLNHIPTKILTDTFKVEKNGTKRS